MIKHKLSLALCFLLGWPLALLSQTFTIQVQNMARQPIAGALIFDSKKLQLGQTDADGRYILRTQAMKNLGEWEVNWNGIV